MITTTMLRGQTAIPAKIRKAFGIGKNTKLEWVNEGNFIKVIPLGTDTVVGSRGMFSTGKLGKALLRERKKDAKQE